MIRSKKYLEFIRSKICIVCWSRQTVVAHHVRTGTDGGTGLKPSDTYTLPLCHRCHMDCHAGEKTFWEERNINPFHEVSKNITEFLKTGGKF